MPSTNSVSNPRPRLSSTVITPSLPTFSITSAMRLPISRSAAELLAMLAISSRPWTGVARLLMYSTAARVAMSMPFLSCMGLAPAARFFIPSCTRAWASTVAVVVPSPATSLVLVAASLRSWAPMFSKGSLSSISLATVTPSWVMVGAPSFRSRATLRPLGPSVVFTALATVSMPIRMDCLADSLNSICFAIFVYSSYIIVRYCVFLAALLGNDCQYVALAEDEVFLVDLLDFGAGVLGVEHLIAHFEIYGGAGAVVLKL